MTLTNDLKTIGMLLLIMVLVSGTLIIGIDIIYRVYTCCNC